MINPSTLALGAGLLLLTGCASHEQLAKPAQPSELQMLEAHLTGSFSSEQQSIDDEEFFHIVLHMVPIWVDRNDGPWLYVEQAVAEASERPYRQRVYKLEQREGALLVSRVFTFPDPMAHSGAWESDAPLASLSPDDLEERDGCAIFLTWDGDSFVGSTDANNCKSTLRGASYATSEVDLHSDRLITWDRGFDQSGEQVWGAVKGGYIFDRISD